MSKFCCKHCGMITDNPEIEAFFDLGDQHFYKVTCPVYLAETRFARTEPFPTDKTDDDSTLRITLTPATKFSEMLGAEIDKAEELGFRIKGIELPKLAEFRGIPIGYY